MELQAVVNLIKNQYKISKESELINSSFLILLVIFGIILFFVSDYVKFSSYCLMTIGAVLILFSLGCGIVNSIEKSKRKFFLENLRESDVSGNLSPQSVEILFRYFRKKGKVKRNYIGDFLKKLFPAMIFPIFKKVIEEYWPELFNRYLSLDVIIFFIAILLYFILIIVVLIDLTQSKETDNSIIADALYDFLLEKRFRQINQ